MRKSVKEVVILGSLMVSIEIPRVYLLSLYYCLIVAKKNPGKVLV